MPKTHRQPLKRHHKFFVYIIEDKYGNYYTGYTNNIDKRLALHQKGKGAKYLRGRQPLKLVFVKPYAYYKSALNAERKIKMLTREQKKELIQRRQNKQWK